MKLRHTATGVYFLCIVLSVQSPCMAGTIEEIASLLQFIEQSKCTFIRNGKPHDAFATRQHIENKYNYYKEQIATTEDFIQYSATKSSITGKPYSVICNGMRMNSSDWLNAELDRMRTP